MNNKMRLTNVVAHVAEVPRDVVILSYARTPIGSFGSLLSDIDASSLGGVAMKGCFDRVGIRSLITPNDVDEMFFGHVLSSGCGQAPVRQAALKAGIPVHVPCTSVNKVCASGMKALTLGSALIRGGSHRVCVVGGMESMSRVPYFLPSHRSGRRLGHDSILDGLILDGLWDPYSDKHMGSCAGKTARDFGIDRQAQDEYAALSAERAVESHKNGYFKEEIVSVDIGRRKQMTMTADEQLSKLNPKRLSELKPAFELDGTVTAGNASSISDGAAALVISERYFANQRGVTPIATVLSWADGEREPADFAIAPSIAIQKALSIAGLTVDEIDLWEINEAFAAVVLANAKLLNIPLSKVNVFGGAISLGHPLGCSGARIICTLLSAMKHRSAKLGCAAICNGGGGSTAVIIRM